MSFLLYVINVFRAPIAWILTKRVPKQAEERGLYDLEADLLAGHPTSLGAYAGLVTLVVNTASKCGFTPQYAELEELQQEYGERGFTVLGFPCGDFGGQELGSGDEIQSFCDSRFSISFPLFAKAKVKDDPRTPVFDYLARTSGAVPRWNFGKYLVGRDGRVRAFYATPIRPTSTKVRREIESALGR
ncbi:MAG: glutathione peroxidase [Planctomycetota bacterium]|nr:glutathione peroxidase [Planctomycetota bacterium]